MRGAILIAHRSIFIGLVGVTLFKALEPGATGVSGFTDKVLHFTAFYVLSLSAACAAPRRHPMLIALALLALGLAIEAVQQLPAIGRSASWLDVAADLAGVGAALAPAAVLRWRTGFGPRHS